MLYMEIQRMGRIIAIIKAGLLVLRKRRMEKRIVKNAKGKSTGLVAIPRVRNRLKNQI